MIPKFYGVNLDRNDPFLRHNLNRLEKRFRERYYSSMQKKLKREKAGKAIHKTMAKSILDNRKRIVMTRTIKKLILINED